MCQGVVSVAYAPSAVGWVAMCLNFHNFFQPGDNEVLFSGGLNRSGVDPPLSSSRACLMTFIANSVP